MDNQNATLLKNLVDACNNCMWLVTGGVQGSKAHVVYLRRFLHSDSTLQTRLVLASVRPDAKAHAQA